MSNQWHTRDGGDHRPPRAVANGLVLRTQRGSIGQHWWAQRWLAALDERAGANEVAAGRRYARRGQIISLTVTPGQVHAVVQCVATAPLTLRMTFATLTPAQWSQIFAELSTQALTLVELLGGRLPTDLEPVFFRAGAALFPQAPAEPRCHCDCQPGELVCKHLVAVGCLFAEQLDHDPFLLLQLRGEGREALLGRFRDRWGTPPPPPAVTTGPPLNQMLRHYYDVQPPTPPAEAAADLPSEPPPDDPRPLDVLARLGFPPFFPAGDRGVVQALRNLYDEA